MNTEILLGIVAYRQEPRPIAWIARETGLDMKDVRAVLRVAGDSVPKSEIALDKYDQAVYFIGQGVTLSEIWRTLGGDYRTYVRWFPRHRIENGSEEHKQASAMGRKLRRIERKK